LPAAASWPGSVRRIWGSAKDDLYAIGLFGMPILHYDGLLWSQVTEPREWMTSIWGTGPNDVWVGGELSPNGDTGLVWRFDGSSWIDMAFPGPSVRTIWGSGPDDVWVVASVAWCTTEVWHWDGAVWSSVPNANVLPTADHSGAPAAAWGSGTDQWVVGFGGTLSHGQNGTWTTVSKTVVDALSIRDVAGVAQDLWVVGGGGSYRFDSASARWDGSAWTSMPTPPESFNLVGLGYLSSTEVWAIDSSGAVLRWDGTAWSIESSVGFLPVALLVRSPDDIWVAGQGGHVAHWDGSGWYDVPSTVHFALTGIAARNASEVWVVGNDAESDGCVLSCTPTECVQLAAAPMTHVASTGPGNAWAVGFNGLILRWDGVTWTDSPSGTTKWLNGVWAGAPNDAWAVGQDGVALHWNGVGWKPADVGAGGGLRRITRADAGRLWAVGEGAAILYKDP
jgi:hypothetical protein